MQLKLMPTLPHAQQIPSAIGDSRSSSVHHYLSPFIVRHGRLDVLAGVDACRPSRCAH
jgi:hypothetical protein